MSNMLNRRRTPFGARLPVTVSTPAIAADAPSGALFVKWAKGDLNPHVPKDTGT